jgi:copper(I)-binding protein
VVGAFALAGCGAGQITQTSSQQSGVGGASANVGQIAVREAAFAFTGDGKTAAVYRAGSEAPLTMTVVNFGSQVDKLTNVSSPAAESVKITGDGTIASGRVLLVEGLPAGEPAGAPGEAAPGASAQATPAPGGRATPAPGASAQATPAPGASARATPAAGASPTLASGASATATPAPGAGATPAPGGALPGARPAPATAGPAAESTEAAGAGAPTSGQVTPGTTTAQVVFTGLKEDLKVGPTYPVVLTFERAGDVTLQVPVANPSENQGPTGE